MLIRELLEAPSLQTTLNAVATDVGTNIQSLYRELDIALDRMIAKNGSSEHFEFIAGGITSRWMQSNWPRLNAELWDLSRQAGSNGLPLKQWLASRANTFNAIANTLPKILETLATKLGDVHLKKSCEFWANANERLIAKSKEAKEPKEIDFKKTATTPAVKKTSTIPGQNVQVELIVNDILSKLPSGVAGEIRNAISRSSNKLQDLQKELNQRGISINR